MTIESLIRRLDARSEAVADSECVRWTGYRDRLGWGRIKFSGEVWLVHRAAWLVNYGPIPDGEGVLHSCHDRACVNPKHLLLGTPQDRIYHMVAAGRHRNGKAYGERAKPMTRRWGKKPVRKDEMYIANKLPLGMSND